MQETKTKIRFSAWILIYLLLTAIVPIGMPLAETDLTSEKTHDETFYARMCGPLSLSILCEMFGQKVDPETIVKMAGAIDDSGKGRATGTSMKALADVAYLLGFKAVRMKVSLQNLKNLGAPAIAHTSKNGRNHFLVVEGVVQDKFRLLEVDGTTHLLSPTEFSNIYKGAVLVISKPSQTATTTPPSIQTEEILYDFGYDFGFAQHQQTLMHTFRLKNIGSQPLEILEVGSSYPCTAVLLSETTVLPNQIAEIEASFDTQYRRGRQNASIEVRTDDPNRPVIHFTLTGVVSGLVRVVPNPLHLKNISNTESIQKTINIYDPGDDRLKVKRVQSSSPYITTKLQHIYRDGLTAKLFVTIKPGLPFGEFKEKLTLLTEGYRYPQVEVLVMGKVVGAIRLAPEQFFLGFVKTGEVKRSRVRLRKKGTPDLEILRIENTHPAITTDVEAIKTGQEYEIGVSFTAPAATGKADGLIKIHTNDTEQPLFEVPFYAIVK